LPGSWTARKETDGSISVVTLGQRIVPEITNEYKRQSTVSRPKAITLNGSEGYIEFKNPPDGRYYALQGTLQWVDGNDKNDILPVAGFRVLASDQEWTDIYFDPSNETLVVDRSSSSLVHSCTSHYSFSKQPLS
jgi:beta-fructofuranosidase